MRNSELEIVEVADQAFAVVGRAGSANSGFVIGGESVALIDAQASPRLGAELRKAIRAITSVPVEFAVLTHHHGDHIFGLQAWPKLVTFAHVNCEKVLRQLAPGSDERSLLTFAEKLDIFVGAPAAKLIASHPDHPIIQRLVGPDYADVELHRPLPIKEYPFVVDLGGIQLRITAPGPAHGTDDLLVDVPDRSIRFTGDLGFIERLPAVTAPHIDGWVRVTERLMAESSSIIVPGHGPIATPGELSVQLAYLQALVGLQNGATTDSEFSRFSNLPGFDRWHQINVTLAEVAK